MDRNERTSILITGVGDTVGQALIKAARMSAVPCRVVGTDRTVVCVGLRWVDRGFVFPHCGDADAYLKEMARVCTAEGVRLILPGSEKELAVLSQNAEALRSQTGAVVVASPPEVLRVALNKWETCRFLRQAGRNFPRFARLDDDGEVRRLVEALGFPLIAKPFHGTGARGLQTVRSWEDVARARASGGPCVLQELLQPEDEEYSVEVYTLRDGRQAGAICYRRGQLIAGDTYRAHVVANEAAQAEARAVAAALGAAGPCNVQMRMTDRGPVTFEINPRFSGGVSIRAHFGFNEVEMALRDLVLGEPVPPPVTRTGTALRFWEELYLDDESGSGAPAPSGTAEKPAPPRAASVMEILGTEDSARWAEVVGRAVRHDFHHLPQYHRLAEQRGEGVAHLFVYREGDVTIALPLLLRPVDAASAAGWYDATSVYGYGGPVASRPAVPEPVVRNFQKALAGALAERSVVAVFSRMHPLIEQCGLLAGLGECRAGGQTVSIDLTRPPEAQWAEYSKSCKKTIKKLREKGFVGLHDVERRYLPELVSVYHETMRRAGARPFYFFDREYFERLVAELGPAVHLFVALADGAVAAASLATICDGIVQDYLGGTRDAFLKDSPDRLVVDTERLWAAGQGARVLHLGGGVGAENDSLFRYKAAFSNRRHTFRTWRWVLRPEVYRALCDERERRHGRNAPHDPTPDYFPAYRSPVLPADSPVR